MYYLVGLHFHTHSIVYPKYKTNRRESDLCSCPEASTGFESMTSVIPVLPVEASDFFLGFLCNCLSCFTTTKSTFTSILYLQFMYMIHIINICTSSLSTLTVRHVCDCSHITGEVCGTSPRTGQHYLRVSS